MRILHVAARLQPGSGVAEVVAMLALHARKHGHDVTIAALEGPAAPAVHQAQVAGVARVAYRTSVGYFSLNMLLGLGHLVREADVVHVHSNWTFPVWWGAWCALRAEKRLVMSPHGCFDPVRLRHSRWKKWLVGWIDCALLQRADVVHATSEMEREWTERFLLPPRGRKGKGKRACNWAGAKVVVVPNGVFLRPPSGRKGDGKKTVLYLGRLHPLKGLDLLVEAWGTLIHKGYIGQEGKNVQRPTLNAQCSCELALPGLRQRSHHSEEKPTSELPTPISLDWRLVIAGPDEQGTQAALERQARSVGLLESIVFAGLVYGEEKEQLLESADLFVMPSRSENFGLVVAEALAAGVPVVATQAAPWAELLGCHDDDPACDDSMAARTSVITENGRCGWWVEVGVEPLAEALRAAMELSDEARRAMGENGRRLVERKYQWEAISTRLEDVYLGGTRS